jgi:hypothetical protein
MLSISPAIRIFVHALPIDSGLGTKRFCAQERIPEYRIY